MIFHGSMELADALELDAWRALASATDLDGAIALLARLAHERCNVDELVVRALDEASTLVETLAPAALAAPPTPIDGEFAMEITRALAPGAPVEPRGPWAAPILRGSGPPGARMRVMQLEIRRFATRSAFAVATTRNDRLDLDMLLRCFGGPIAAAVENYWRIQTLVHANEAVLADRQALLLRLQRQDISDAIIGSAVGLRDVMERVERVAPTAAPVLLLGETGSGKEVIARAIHARSVRGRGPILRVNCGAISPELVDSELFGHERGSFTGATATRKGWFERADGGTLFLDEIGELSMGAQVRLLRVLQDGTLERVGGDRVLRVDVRLVAATHRNLKEMVAAGTFREDLWFRISTFPIQIPPLRARREDVRPLAEHFAKQAGLRLAGTPLTVSDADAEHLAQYRWPGNVRELAAVIERAAILGSGRRLEITAALGDVPAPRPVTVPPMSAARSEKRTLDDAMASHIRGVLEQTRGKIEGRDGAAAALGINPHTLRARMRKLKVEWSTYRR